MRVVCIADTHGKHEQLNLPGGDVLVHAGDFCSRGYPEDFRRSVDWWADRPFDRTLLVPGNHELVLDPSASRSSTTNHHREEALEYVRTCESITYLEDQTTRIEDYFVYGTPWTPEFNDWAFMDDEEGLADRFDEIPEETDVLVSHGPPKGIRDEVPITNSTSVLDSQLKEGPDGQLQIKHKSVGSTALREAVERVEPDVHLFGHIHEGYGREEQNGIQFINCSVLDGDYNLTNKPVVIER